MQIRLGYEFKYTFAQSTPIILTLNVHHSRAKDLLEVDRLQTAPAVPLRGYHDGFGNWCTRLVAPAGSFRVWSQALIHDSGLPDVVASSAQQVPVDALPDATLVYLLGSRYCETDRLSDIAWKLFEQTPPGWARVQAICDFVHRHITFGHEHARATKTAREAYDEGKGVCRDYAHLAIAFCRSIIR